MNAAIPVQNLSLLPSAIPGSALSAVKFLVFFPTVCCQVDSPIWNPLLLFLVALYSWWSYKGCRKPSIQRKSSLKSSSGPRLSQSSGPGLEASPVPSLVQSLEPCSIPSASLSRKPSNALSLGLSSTSSVR